MGLGDYKKILKTEPCKLFCFKNNFLFCFKNNFLVKVTRTKFPETFFWGEGWITRGCITWWREHSFSAATKEYYGKKFSKLLKLVFSLLFFRFFGGLILDIKRKAPFFWSDFRDALSLQCLASFLFLYCACMSPVITFGGLLGEATEGRIVCVKSELSKQTYICRFVVSIFFIITVVAWGCNL